MPALRVTILSNGYGEDTVGATLVKELEHQSPGLDLQAFPIVDEGRAYEGLVPLLGPRQRMPSGGLTLHSAHYLWQDLKAGILTMTLRQLRELSKLQTDILVVVGDVYALLLSNLVRCQVRYYVQTLVSAHHVQDAGVRFHRLTMERFTGLERWLVRRTVARMYVRDKATETYLQGLGVGRARFLGNPMLDALELDASDLNLPLSAPVIALLPGSRAYAGHALSLMLQSLAHWPEATGLVAWARQEDPPEVPGWERVLTPHDKPGQRACFKRPGQIVHLLQGHFTAALQSAQLVLGTAGTAHEQAAALAKPVISFPLPPWYTASFLANQQRLLGDALTLTQAEPEVIATTLRDLWHDETRLARARQAGPERLGAAGGSRTIVTDLLRHYASACASSS